MPSSHFKILFTFSCSDWVRSSTLYSSLLDPFFYFIQSAVWFIQFNYYLLQLYDFGLGLSSFFYLVLEVLTVYIHSSSQFSEPIYDLSTLICILSSLSDKLSVSLRIFSEVLCCSLVWSIFFSFFILLDSLRWFLCINETAISPRFEGIVYALIEPYRSTLPQLLILSQTSVSIQVALFIFYNPQPVVCEDQIFL